ncbi:hypothetical protein HD599_000773 [Conyzicola lurida]|uniref:Uncharacterized protein n=1 Tax=Conyzicola lurida TaxID=1172621 RepID=A0A841AFB1_9MICO|nr:hypothetical protein [Conyzicola lurida]MBB5842450.1 hypothetical protein [Conyzicola lurida]
MQGRMTAVVAAASVVALAVAGASWAYSQPTLPGAALIVGYYGPPSRITLATRTVEPGSYLLGYGALVQFFSTSPTAMLECGLVDTTGRIGYIDQIVSAVEPTGRWTRIGSSAVYDIPEVTLGIRCIPNGEGEIGIGFRNAEIIARQFD